MIAAELEAVLHSVGGASVLDSQQVRLLGRRAFAPAEGQPQEEARSEGAQQVAALEEERWTSYPLLDFGVLIEDGLVAGSSVTPSK